MRLTIVMIVAMSAVWSGLIALHQSVTKPSEFEQTVTGLGSVPTPTLIYNFKIPGSHTYAVGTSSVLALNVDCAPNPFWDAQVAEVNRIKDAQRLLWKDLPPELPVKNYPKFSSDAIAVVEVALRVRPDLTPDAARTLAE